MSQGGKGGPVGGLRGRMSQGVSRQVRATSPWVVAGVIGALAGCGGGGGGTPTSAQISFYSDRSVILPKQGSTYQLVAKANGKITWSTSDAQQVSVSPTGLVIAATQNGSATITATAPGSDPVTASVIVAAPGPQTVLVNSADVRMASGSNVALTANSTTKSIVAGDIVVSGDKAGLLGKVQSVSSNAQSVTLQTAPASLPQAFPNLNVHLSGAPTTMTLLVTRGRAALIAPNGRTVAVGRAGGFSCEDSAGATVNATVTGPSFNAPVQANLDATLVTQNSSVQQFSITANVKITAQMKTGSVAFAANGQTDFTCTEELPDLSLPGVPVGPIDIEGTLTPEAEITISANANASLTLSGPTVSDSFLVDGGVTWTPAGGWQASITDSSSGPTVAPPGFQFTAQVQGKISAGIRADTGISAKAADFELVAASFAFDQLEAALNFSMAAPLSYTSPGYTGPTWDADLNLSSGPELKITGPVADLLNHMGVPTNLGAWSLYSKSVKLAESPTPTLTASSPTVSQGGSDILTASQPASYSGSSVKFYAFPTSGAAAALGSATVGSTGGATFNWSPTAGQYGAFQIGSFLFGDAFGAAGFPYPSSQVAVTAGGGTVNVGVH